MQLVMGLGTNDTETLFRNAGGCFAQMLGGYSAVRGMNKKRKQRHEGSLQAPSQCSAVECTVEFPRNQARCPVCGTLR